MTRLQYFAMVAALAASCAGASAADNDKAAAEKQQKLIATLQSTAAPAEKALSAAYQRMPDQDACAEKLVGAMPKASVSAKRGLREVLATLGGAKALHAVAAAAKDANPEIQDAGSRLLGEWMSVDAAPVLLDLAKTAADEKYRIRAMRGYIRLARQFAMPDAQRAEMCRIALETAAREDEKKLVLVVLERYPSVDTLSLALKAAKIPALKDEATAASLAIAQKVGGNAVDLNKVLAEVGHRPMKIEILKAEYGEGSQVKDVTAVVRQCARDFPVIALPSPDYNSSFGGDPAPGVVKQLKIQYRLTGKKGEATFQENATILLPMPK